MSLTLPVALLAGSALSAGGSLLSGFINRKSYNDNLDYQKQLQQEIFNREDTAYQRAVADAQKVGINPMALAGSGGAQAGSVVPTTPFQDNSINDALSNIYNALAGASQVSSLVNEFKTGNIQRDLLRSQQMKAKMENALFAFENGLQVNNDGSISLTKDSPIIKKILQQAEIDSKVASTEGQKISNKRNERVLNYQERTGTTDVTPDKVQVVTSGADIANQKLKDFTNPPSSDEDGVARAFTEDALDKTLNDMLNETAQMIEDANEKHKNKKSGFFRRYIKYRFGF